MDFSKLREMYYLKYNEELPFGEENIESFDKGRLVLSSELVKFYEMRYIQYKKNNEKPNLDLDEVLNEFNKAPQFVNELLIKAKGHFLQFYVSEDYGKIVCVFPKWKFQELTSYS